MPAQGICFQHDCPWKGSAAAPDPKNCNVCRFNQTRPDPLTDEEIVQLRELLREKLAEAGVSK